MRYLTLLAALVAATARAQSPPQSGFFADAQVLWFDSQISEDFELAPRFIAGYDDMFGGRVRYWTYDHETEVRGGVTGSDVDRRLDFDVVDLEATTRVKYAWSDFQFAGGVRIASIESSTYSIPWDFTAHEESTLAGVTLAGNGRTPIAVNDTWGVSFIYGGRLSLLQGDWDGEIDNSPIFQPILNIQNERFVVPEVSTGVEVNYGRTFTHLSVEMQDWRGRPYDGMPGHNFGFTGAGFDLGFVF